jgi:methionyl-tRNA formyltransferase
VVALTTLQHGIASHVLPALHAATGVEVAGVVLAGPGSRTPRRDLVRRIRKTARIGLMGALNGLRLRAWYEDREAVDIEAQCGTLGIPCWRAPCVNCDETRSLLRASGADLGLSLGNGYIARSVFAIPRYGTVNLHTEVLPDFRGGVHSIIWPIHEGRDVTGFAIHQVDASFDTGDILYQETHPIVFHPTLRETVERNVVAIRQRIPEAFAMVCRDYPALKAASRPQGPGRSYTTPTIWQFLRMIRNHRQMYRRSLAPRTAGAR